MPTRQPPTPAEIVAALRLQPDRAVLWQHAVQQIKTDLRTTKQRAEEWLVQAVAPADAELIAVWTPGGSVMTGPNTSEHLTARGWTMSEAVRLDFTAEGRRVPVGGGAFGEPAAFREPWVLRRADLDAMRPLIAQEQTAEIRRFEERVRRDVAAFQEHHGDALDTIRQWLDPVIVAASVDTLRTRIADDAVVGDILHVRERHGDAVRREDHCTLVITLRGRQIDALAALVRVNDAPEGSIEDLIARSSLGTPYARAMAAMTPPEVAAEIVRRADARLSAGDEPADEGSQQ